MERDTYEAIKTEWCKISNTEQRNLIYSYIKGDSNGLRGSWMEFLQKQFGLTCPTAQLTGQSATRKRSLSQAYRQAVFNHRQV